MRSIKFLIATGLVVLILAACASTSVVESARPASAGEAVVFVIRKDYPPTGFTGELTANGQILAEMKDDSYVEVNVPVGDVAMALEFAPTLGFSNEAFEFIINPYEAKYILLTGDVTSEGFAFPIFKYKWSLNAYELSADAAMDIIDSL